MRLLLMALTLAAPVCRCMRIAHAPPRSITPRMMCAIEPAELVATRLWVERVVIGLSLCPWASPVKDRIRYCLERSADPPELFTRLLAELQLLARSDPSEVETTVLVAPNVCTDDFDSFHAFVTDVSEFLEDEGLADHFQLVGFHPAHRFEGDEPDAPGNYVNRSPYPMVHVLREASVSAAVDAQPAAGTEVPRANQQLLSRLGSQHLAEMLRGACDDASTK